MTKDEYLADAHEMEEIAKEMELIGAEGSSIEARSLAGHYRIQAAKQEPFARIMRVLKERWANL